MLRINLNTLHGGLMLASKIKVLRPLLESNEGQHLTAYINNHQNVFELRQQLREILDIAYEYLSPVMNPEVLVRFLAPIHNTIEDTDLLKRLKNNIGIFRNEKIFRIISLPVPVEQSCIVATSFHVKPLLRWMQLDRDFLFLGMNESSACLYQGNQNTLTLIDSIIFPTSQKNALGLSAKRIWSKNQSDKESINRLSTWLFNLTKHESMRLFISGPKELILRLENDMPTLNIHKLDDVRTFDQDTVLELCTEIRSQLKTIADKDLEKSIMEFYHAEDLNMTSKNIFQITKSAIRGQVKKLIIADGINIFGKIDKNTGGLSIHPVHLDNEDDDILDDLAQEVLSHGGEVVVAPRELIPKGRPILAILENINPEITKLNSKQLLLRNKYERGAI